MKGSNSKQNKSLNLRLVLSQIATQSPLSRADLARATLLTKQTITNLVDELISHQLVIETGQLKAGVGKPSTMLMLNGPGLFSLGIRVWPQRLELALSDLTGQLLAHQSTTRRPELSLVSQVCSFSQEFLQQSGHTHGQLLGAGLTIVTATTAEPEQRHQELQLLQQQLAGALQLPIIAAHTAAACAAYQLLHGEARQLDSFCYIHLGQQIDTAMVFERRLLLGQQGLTGALGDIFVTPDQDHRTGDFGRLNDFASVRSLQQFVDKKLPGLALDSADGFDRLAASADKIAPWFDRATEPMRVAIHTLETLFNSQTIIIGGEVSTWFLDKLISKLRPFIPSIAQYGPRDVPRLIKTPQVEQVAMQGLTSLPLHAALRPEQAQQVQLPLASVLDARQQLLFGADTGATEETED